MNNCINTSMNNLIVSYNKNNFIDEDIVIDNEIEFKETSLVYELMFPPLQEVKDNVKDNLSLSQNLYISNNQSNEIKWVSVKTSPRKISSKKRTRSGGDKYLPSETDVKMCDICDFPEKLNNILMQDHYERIQRCGAIIYKLTDQGLKFALGIDTIFNEYTDFGGGVKKEDLTVIDGGLRELTEESIGIFGFIKSDELKNFLALYTSRTMIMFIKTDINEDQITKLFNERVKYIDNPEVNGITWLTTSEFISLLEGNLIHGRKIFTRIRDICYTAYKEHDFINLL